MGILGIHIAAVAAGDALQRTRQIACPVCSSELSRMSGLFSKMDLTVVFAAPARPIVASSSIKTGALFFGTGWSTKGEEMTHQYLGQVIGKGEYTGNAQQCIAGMHTICRPDDELVVRKDTIRVRRARVCVVQAEPIHIEHVLLRYVHHGRVCWHTVRTPLHIDDKAVRWCRLCSPRWENDTCAQN